MKPLQPPNGEKNKTRKTINEIKHEPTPDKQPSVASASCSQKKTLPIIRCICGAKILVLPDLTAMNQAIANHLKEHKKTQKPSKTGPEIADVEQLLFEQLFGLAAENTQ